MPRLFRPPLRLPESPSDRYPLPSRIQIRMGRNRENNNNNKLKKKIPRKKRQRLY